MKGEFDAEQFRANAASIVVDLSHHFELLEGLIAFRLAGMPFGEHATPIIEEFFSMYNLSL